MRSALVGVLLLLSSTVVGLRADDEPIALKRTDLEKLEGVWELKTDPKEGGKGTVRATIKLYKADGKTDDFGRILYDYTADGFKVTNAPSGGISFAGIKRGKTTLIVTSETFSRAPFKVEPSEKLSAGFEIKDNVLTLDLSKSLKAFVPSSVRKMTIDWGKATWEKVKK